MKRHTLRLPLSTGEVPAEFYLKCVGRGWECGMQLGNEAVFAGSFTRMRDAAKWYARMPGVARSFVNKCRREDGEGTRLPLRWFRQSLRNELGRDYFEFLRKACDQGRRDFARAVRRHEAELARRRSARPGKVRSPYYRRAA